MSELKLKTITYTVDEQDAAPEVDQFLVTRTRAGQPSTVYHIAEVKPTRGPHTFKLSVYTAADLKPYARVEGDKVYVREEKAWLLVWNSRKKKHEPDAFTHEQVFGDFLQKHGSPGVVLLLLRQGRVYCYGQWTDVVGMQAVLGWYRHADEIAFDAAWGAEAAWGELPQALPVRYGPADTETPLRLLNMVDDHMASEAVVLYYYAQGQGWETTTWGSALNSKPEAKAWLENLWSQRPANQALWDGTPNEPGGFCPATCAEVLARTRVGQNKVIEDLMQGYPQIDLTKCLQ
jgi:hypothetical protein